MDQEARQQQQLDSLDRDAQRVLVHDACSSGATEVVRTILMEIAAANGLSTITTWLDARDSDGDTLLFVAARNGHLAVVKLLCEAGASVDARILGNDTPLLEAAGHGHLDIVTHASAAVDCERATAVEESLESTIPLHELEWSHSEASSELRRATWLGTPVLVQSVDNDDHSCETVTHMLRHPHVLEQYGWTGSRDSRYVVYEDASNGTLTNYLARLSGRDGATLWRLLYEAALGLQHLHDQHVVHTDVTCSSIVIDSNGVAKLARFGSAKAVGWQWRSPEHMRGDQQTRAADIYSFGMCILEAATGQAPWHAVSNDIDDVRRRVLQGELPPRPDSLSARHWRLIEVMCAFAPQQRVAIATVVQWLHAFAYE